VVRYVCSHRGFIVVINVEIKKEMKNKRERLKNKAWKVFSDWIKQRDDYHCVSCGAFDANQAGHFFHNVLDFDEDNINCQCVRCNHYLSGNLAQYSVYLLSKLGKRRFEALYFRHFLDLKSTKRDEKYYQDIIEKYKQ
jgi:hypothetical protein